LVAGRVFFGFEVVSEGVVGGEKILFEGLELLTIEGV
jgi:hypothetical protein